MIGPAAEEAFGRRHFMDLLTSFAAERELRVVVGTKEVGFISPLALPHHDAQGDHKAILMNGRAWHVAAIDWRNFTVHVSQASAAADVRWQSAPVALSFELMRAQRDIILGATPDVPLTQRAQASLERVREQHAPHVSDTGLVAERRGTDVRLWTWAGLKANETLRAALGDPEGRSENAVMSIQDLDDVSAINRADIDCEHRVRATTWGLTLAYDRPCGCLRVDVSAPGGGVHQAAGRVGSDLIGA